MHCARVRVRDALQTTVVHVGTATRRFMTMHVHLS